MQTKIVSLGVAAALVFGLVGAGLPVANTPVAVAQTCTNRYANRVVSHTRAENPFVTGNNPASLAGNPSLVLVRDNDVEDFYALKGEGDGYGSVVVAFDQPIVNVSGPDFYITYKDLLVQEQETANVLASNDGVNFHLVGTVVPTTTTIHQLEDHAYDLSAANLASATHIQIKNTNRTDAAITANDTYQANIGPDIDGIYVKTCVTASTPQCSDAKDNDGDGKIDYPADLGCVNPTDDDERDKPECSDGRDNDGDGKIDAADPGCHTDGNPSNDLSFDSEDDDERDVKKVVKVVKAATVVQPAAVAVTAKTGAGMVGLFTTLTGLTGLALSLRRSIN